MRRVYRYKLRSPYREKLEDLQTRWDADATLRAAQPKWQENVWRGVYRTFLHRIHGGHCAFCEATVTAGTNGDVEHFHPKSLYRKHKFQWANWLLSCKNCNTAKSDADTKKEKWIDPRIEDPWPLLRVLPTGALAPAAKLLKNTRAANTIKGADLNCDRTKRSDQLKDLRQKAVEQMDCLIDSYKRAQLGSDAELKTLTESAVLNQCTDRFSQFSGVCLCYLYWRVQGKTAPKALLKRALKKVRASKLKADDVFAPP